MDTMRALVLTGPGRAEVQAVPIPRPGRGDVVVDVARVGICGTDEELFRGDMAYLHTGRSRYPLRPGHEWCGVVREVGAGVDAAWVGRRVTGHTMLWCGRCDRCLDGRRHVCREMVEVGVALGFDGALAERLRVPAESLLALPDAVDDAAGALVEPGGNAWRCAAAAHARPGARILVWGSGSIGRLVAAFAAAEGAEVHLVGRRETSLEGVAAFGVTAAWTQDEIPDLPFHAVVDATNDPSVPARAVASVEPGGRVVLIGLAGSPSRIDTRDLVLRDVSAVGILGGSPGLAETIRHYADGTVDPRPLVAATVSLEAIPDVLAGTFPGPRGPKIHCDPRPERANGGSPA
jgi:2-desacetyl-2-hydroxyethyl bacteriochlorophyllide A dehydrogenase